MKTKIHTLFYFAFLVLLGSCELNSNVKPAGLPEALSVFKSSSQASQLNSLFPEYASNLKYENYWKENFNGEEVYAVPSVVDDKNMAVLYVGLTQKSGLEVRSFREQSATVHFTGLSKGVSVSWNGVKIAEHQYRLDFNQTEPTINGKESVAQETYAQCVGRVYTTAKNACYSDPICGMMCDIIVSCKSSMGAAAAWTCLPF